MYQERLLAYMQALQEMPDYGKGNKRKNEGQSALSEVD